MRFPTFLTLFFLSLFLFSPSPTLAQEDDAKTRKRAERKQQLQTLDATLGFILDLRKEVKRLGEALKELEGEERKKAALLYKQKSVKLQSLEQDFKRIASGLDAVHFVGDGDKPLKWEKEVLDLVSPLINELKSMTAKPRKIEKLRIQVAHAEEIIPEIKDALKNLKRLTERTKNPSLQEELKLLSKEWEDREKTAKSQLTVARLQLQELTKEDKTLVESSSDIVKVFFKSRGRNLILAIATFLGIFMLLRLLHRLIYALSPLHKRPKRPFYIRLLDVAYHIFTILGSLMGMLVILYLSGDWMLLSVAIIFLFGVLWTTKQAIPIFWKEIQMLLNISTVREHERIIYNGIPYRVASLNLSTTLENPALENCSIRLPVRQLIGTISRPTSPDEPWFPSHCGDWVMLSDGSTGLVKHQTPEMVQLLVKGGSLKTIPTTTFLSMSPTKLSERFRIGSTFGISYKHQAQSLTEIPAFLTQFITQRYQEEQYQALLITVAVEFKAANSSSLDYQLAAEFHGQAAPDYYKLERLLQRFAVEACNIKGWEIPYQTVSIINVPSK